MAWQRLAAAAVIAGLLAACREPQPPSDGHPFTPSSGPHPVVVAVGDIACPGQPCDEQRQTASLVAKIDPAALLLVGDIQYQDGRLADFKASYDPTWGRFADVARPVPGNHEYHLAGAAGYFDYFGAAAHEDQGGWYSFDVGEWHVVAVNSGEGKVSPEQLGWIESDLAKDDHRCELAYWHHPRWSSGTRHGPDPDMDPLWKVLHQAGVDVVANAHEHNYERFAPLDPEGRPDPAAGIREFVAGTGGKSNYPFGDPMTGSEKRITDTFGVLELTLRAGGYSWRFVGIGDQVFDQGSGDCHA